jgi:hypothetical protein
MHIDGGFDGLAGTNFEGAPVICGGMGINGYNLGCLKYNKDFNSWSKVNFSFLICFLKMAWSKITISIFPYIDSKFICLY